MSNGTWACYTVGTLKVAEEDNSSWPCREPTPEEPFVPCCGAASYCFSDNYCMGNALGPRHYYIAGCTDPNFSAPACSTHCEYEFSKTVAFNNISNSWVCCNTYNLTGSEPGAQCTLPEDGESWSSPSVDQLTSLTSLPAAFPSNIKTGTPTFSSTSSLSSSVNSNSSGVSSRGTGIGATNTSTTKDTNGGGLTEAARVGIGVGVGLGLALLITIIGILLLRRRHRKNARVNGLQGTSAGGINAKIGELEGSSKKTELAGNSLAELHGRSMPQELPSIGVMGELPAHQKMGLGSTTPTQYYAPYQYHGS